MPISRPRPLIANFFKIKLCLSHCIQQAICLFAHRNLTVIKWSLSKFGCYYCELRIRSVTISYLKLLNYTGCFATCGHYYRKWFPRSLWSKNFI